MKSVMGNAFVSIMKRKKLVRYVLLKLIMKFNAENVVLYFVCIWIKVHNSKYHIVTPKGSLPLCRSLCDLHCSLAVFRCMAMM